jgi:hypothetical protein
MYNSMGLGTTVSSMASVNIKKGRKIKRERKVKRARRVKDVPLALLGKLNLHFKEVEALLMVRLVTELMALTTS